MPVIMEEEIEGELAVPDFANLLDLGDSAFRTTADVPIGAISVETPLQSLMPSELEPVEYVLLAFDKEETTLTLNVQLFV